MYPWIYEGSWLKYWIKVDPDQGFEDRSWSRSIYDPDPNRLYAESMWIRENIGSSMHLVWILNFSLKLLEIFDEQRSIWVYQCDDFRQCQVEVLIIFVFLQIQTARNGN